MLNARIRSTLLVALVIAPAGPLGAQAPGDPLDGTEWELFAFRRTAPISGTHFFIRFDEGRVSGNAGCNGFLASYEVRGDSITVTDIGVEKMMCHEPAGLMEQENYLLHFLADVCEIRFVDDQLRLLRPDQEALTFQPRPLE